MAQLAKKHPKKFNVSEIHQLVRENCFKLKQPLARYTMGKEFTTDIDQADKDPFGKPIQVGYSGTEFCFQQSSTPLCLDPKDPARRLRAIEARARMYNYTLEPTIYEDSITAVQRSNNIANKVINNLSKINQDE